MRVLLRVFVLATAAVAWAAASRAPSSARASCFRPASGTAVAWPAEGESRPGDGPLGTGQDREGAAGATRHGAPGLEIVPVEVQEADGVPVDVIIVDGGNGDVLQRATSTVQRGPEGSIAYDIAVPGGYVPDVTGPRQIKTHISRRADLVRVLEPLRREADIRVHVVDVAGRPVHGARVTEVLRAGGAPPIIALDSEDEPDLPEEGVPELDETGSALKLASADPTRADGWTRVRGVADLLDEHYWIVAGKAKSEAFADVRLGALGGRYTAEIRIPVASTRALMTNCAIGLGGGAGSGCRGRTARQVPATLEVVVRLQSGRMGAGLEVHVGSSARTTDAGGRVLFEGLRPGTYAIDVRDPDFTWSKASIRLGEGEWRTFVFEERPGWTARAALLDSTGRPVPFAFAAVHSEAPVPYLRVEDGVQDLVLYTDVNGEIRLPGMHHAPLDLAFRYGSRSASVTLDEGEPYATVRLPAPQ